MTGNLIKLFPVARSLDSPLWSTLGRGGEGEENPSVGFNPRVLKNYFLSRFSVRCIYVRIVRIIESNRF